MAIKTPKETIVNENQVRYTAPKKSSVDEVNLIDNSKIKPSSLVKVEIIKLLQQIILEANSSNIKNNAQKCIKLLENI